MSTFQFIKDTGFVPYNSCQPYLACSTDSSEGFCDKVDTTCSPINTCRTCDSFGGNGGKCTEIDKVCDRGQLDNDVHQIMAEIYARGPVAACINAEPIVKYQGGVFSDESESKETNHIVSIVGWGMDPDTGVKH